MSIVNEQDQFQAKAILGAFSEKGFKKTSMEDIGSAIGVTRQSIHKRFGSKEACYEWTIQTYLAWMYHEIFTTLLTSEKHPFETLIEVFDVLIGEAVETVKKPFGTETFDAVLKVTHSSHEDWPVRLKSRLADYLILQDLSTADDAPGVAFALISAGKGLLLEEKSRDEFLSDMSSIITSITNLRRNEEI